MKLELNKVYKDENGEQWKIVARHRDGIRHIGVPSTLIDISFFTEEGGNCYNQLTELVGNDFIEIKKPRYFEFEAYVGENPTKKGERIDIESAIDEAFGYPCGRKLVINKNSYRSHYQYTSKWHVTMKEIIE